MRALHFLQILFCASVLPALEPALWAEEFPEVVFVLDGSGSMSGPAGKQTKMAAAKEVLEEIVPNLPSEVRVGLVAYGHRRKGDCSDIEVLVPPGSTDRAGLLALARRIEPVGKTPMSDAVVAAAELLKTKDAETTIVLVSDGIETCAADPCGTIKKLKSTGVRFVLHTVGFAVTPEAREQLECMAQAGGGRYFAAADKAALLAAFDAVKGEVASKVERAKTTTKTAATGLPKLIVRMPAGSESSVAGLRLLASDGKEIKKTEGISPESTHPLPPGNYTVECLFKTPNYGEPTVTSLATISLVPGSTKAIDLGAVAFNVAPLLEEKTGIERVILAEAGSGRETVVVLANSNGYYNFKPKPVLPGVYDVLVHFSCSPAPSKVASDISVLPGKVSRVTLDSGIQFKEVKTTNLSGWDLYPLGAGGEQKEEGASITTPLIAARPPSGNKTTLWMPYIVPPGKYRIEAHVEGMKDPLVVAAEIEIKPGETLEFDSGL